MCDPQSDVKPLIATHNKSKWQNDWDERINKLSKMSILWGHHRFMQEVSGTKFSLAATVFTFLPPAAYTCFPTQGGPYP